LLWGFSLENLDFIGITEHYDDDLQYFAKRYLNVQPSRIISQMLNVGDYRGQPYKIESGLRNEIEAFHAHDMMLYRRALELRAERQALTAMCLTRRTNNMSGYKGYKQ